MGVNTILTHSGRGDQSVEVRSVNPVVMRASTILFKDYDTWQKYRKLRATDRVLSYGARGTTTNFELEKLVCELEGGYRAQLFPTGLAALAMVLLKTMQKPVLTSSSPTLSTVRSARSAISSSARSRLTLLSARPTAQTLKA